MADLGDNDDPSALVPGDPAGLHALAAGWRNASNALAEAGTGLATLDTGPWTGAAYEAFAAHAQRTRPVWLDASDAVSAAGTAVDEYAGVLAWGQRQAGEAIAQYQAGAHDVAAGTLADARAQVASAGDTAGAVVRDAAARATTHPVLTADLRPTMQPPADGEDNPWTDVLGAHPEPGTITADSQRIHILQGNRTGGGHAYGSGVPNKTVFPQGWSDEEIMAAVTDVANQPDRLPVLQANGYFRATGTVNGVTMDVIVRPNGTVRTAYPTAGPGVCVTDANGKPQPLPHQDGGVDEAETQAASEDEEQAAASGDAEVAQAQAVAEQAVAADAAAEVQAEVEAEVAGMEIDMEAADG